MWRSSVQLWGMAENEPKNEAAVALGRLGGMKGGRARAKKLDAAARKKIASKGAEARWSKKRKKR